MTVTVVNALGCCQAGVGVLFSIHHFWPVNEWIRGLCICFSTLKEPYAATQIASVLILSLLLYGELGRVTVGLHEVNWRDLVELMTFYKGNFLCVY